MESEMLKVKNTVSEIYDGKDIRVEFHDNGAPKQIITFTMRPQPGRMPQGFAAHFARKNDLSGIYFISKWAHWWQTSEMDEAISRLRKMGLLSVKSMAYGTSIGGFAALQFAERLNCHSALVISPQVSVDPKIVPFEHRWDDDVRKIEFIHSDARPYIGDKCKYFISFDPLYRLDRMHISMIPNKKNIILLKAPFGGHALADHLLQSGVLKLMVIKAVDGIYDVQELRTKIRAGRRNSQRYYDVLSGYAIGRNRMTLALSAARSWLRHEPNSTAAFLRNVKILKNGNFKDFNLTEMACGFLESSPDDVAVLKILRSSLYQSKAFSEALEVSSRILKLDDGNSDNWRWKSRVLLRVNMAGEAWSVFNQALILFPKDVPLIRVGIQCAMELRLKEQAIQLSDVVRDSGEQNADDILIYAKIGAL